MIRKLLVKPSLGMIGYKELILSIDPETGDPITEQALAKAPDVDEALLHDKGHTLAIIWNMDLPRDLTIPFPSS